MYEKTKMMFSISSQKICLFNVRHNFIYGISNSSNQTKNMGSINKKNCSVNNGVTWKLYKII